MESLGPMTAMESQWDENGNLAKIDARRENFPSKSSNEGDELWDQSHFERDEPQITRGSR